MSRAILVFALCAPELLKAQRLGLPTDDLDKLNIDELFRLEVTSVSRKAQQLSRAPAAVFVLTADDIRRSGATSIPEALQWVPGLTVLQVDGRSWAISARGSTRLYADKILVMIDGRSLYTPLFSGVLWDFLGVPLEDVERIEVVRGPGAVMWGPNAVNGVINIVTKSAQATKGKQVSVAGGNSLYSSAWARWGAAPSERLAWRAWAKFDNLNPAFSSPGYAPTPTSATPVEVPPIQDLDSITGRAGFRLDAQPSEKDQVMFAADMYGMQRREAVFLRGSRPDAAALDLGRTNATGGFVQARWTRTTAAGNESVVQFTYDNNQFDYPFLGNSSDNITLDYQQRRQTGERNELYWGVGFQQFRDNTNGQGSMGFGTPASTYRVGDIVLRDELQLVARRLSLSAGVRLDYNSYTRWEAQPSFRLLYTPSSRQSAWLAVSRAVRVPSRLDRDLLSDYGQIQMEGFPINLKAVGSHAMRSETERSVEGGYRFQSGQRWSVDGAVFWSYYGKLRALSYPREPELVFVGTMPSLQLTMTETNAGKGRSYGAEIWGMWQVRPRWRLIPSYSCLRESLWLPSSPTRGYEWFFSSSTPQNQGLLRSQHDLTPKLQLDLMARARSRNLAFQLPGVLLADARLSWRPAHGTELSVSVQNVTDRTVVETSSEAPFVALPLRRTFVVKWTQMF